MVVSTHAPNRTPLRHLQDYSHTPAGKSFFFTIDLVRAFNKISVAKEDIPKTEIITPFGLYEFAYMTFGLRNAAQTDFCFVFINDILVASENKEQHRTNLEILFKRLFDYGITINVQKCRFGQAEVVFLGYQVTKDGTIPLPEKITAITEFTRPTNPKRLRRFLGMLNVYR